MEVKIGRMGFGAIIRDSLGNFCAAKSLSRYGFLSPVAAEAMGALMAIQLCKDMGFQQIHLEGDARVVVDDVHTMEQNEGGRGLLAEDIRSSLETFSSWKLEFVRRELNQVAHVLARLASKSNMERVWEREPPDCIREIMELERIALHLGREGVG